MAGQVEQREVCIKKATFSTGGHSTPTPRRRHMNKDQQLNHQERPVRMYVYIKHGQPAPILQVVICQLQPNRSRIVGGNPEGSKRRLTTTSRHLASGQGSSVLAANISPPRTADHRLSANRHLLTICYAFRCPLPQRTGLCCHLPGFHAAQPHCALTAELTQRSAPERG